MSPRAALDVVALAERAGLTAFMKLVDRAGLRKDLTLAENVTLFIPSNEAIQVRDCSVKSILFITHNIT